MQNFEKLFCYKFFQRKEIFNVEIFECAKFNQFKFDLNKRTLIFSFISDLSLSLLFKIFGVNN